MKLEVIQHLQLLTSQTLPQTLKVIHLILFTNHTTSAKHLPLSQTTYLNLHPLIMNHISVIYHQTTIPTTQTKSIHINTVILYTLPRKNKSSVMKLTKSMILVISLLCILHNATKGNLHHHPMQIAFPTHLTWIKLQTIPTFALVAYSFKNKYFTWVKIFLGLNIFSLVITQ